MNVIPSTTNPHGGVIPEPEALPELPEEFRRQLAHSLKLWAEQGFQLAWLAIPITKARLIPIAVDAGFRFHHSGRDHLMLTYQLAPEAFIPPFATHYVGVGGVVLNEKRELLVVWEKVDRTRRPYYYKLPGGVLKLGEHLVDGVMREIHEETGVLTRFESLVCLRHAHGYRFGKSDIYFVCRLTPLTQEIRIQEEEILECLWMPVEAFLTHEHVGVFNKRIVQAALESRGGLVPGWIPGYEFDPATREILLPPNRE
jgi:8-oxo-dGTP pyrophosphatase MutT (NUDIX family)